MQRTNFHLTVLLALLGLLGCANAPRVTTAQVPVFPGATVLAPGEHVVSSAILDNVAKEGTNLRRNFRVSGAHTEISYRVPTASASDTDLRGWYFKTLTAAGWRSTYSVAYTVYVNGAGQYLTLFVLSDPANKQDSEVVFTLDDSH